MGSKGQFSDSGVDMPPASLDFNSTSDNGNAPVWLSDFEGMEGLDENLASLQAMRHADYREDAGGGEGGFGLSFPRVSTMNEQTAHGEMPMDLSMWMALPDSTDAIAEPRPSVSGIMSNAAKGGLGHIDQSIGQALAAGAMAGSDSGNLQLKQSNAAPQRQPVGRVRYDASRVAGRNRQSRPSITNGQINDHHHHQNEEAEAGEHDGDKRREKYREKNRLAAAKCRTKKKANVNGLEERHRWMAAENNMRRREERELRDQLTALRTMALEHGAGRCKCGGLHNYNQAKATEMALGHRIGGPMHIPGSSSSDSTSPIVSPLPSSVLGGMGRRLSSPGISDGSQLLSQAFPQAFENVRPGTAHSPFGAQASSDSSVSEQSSEMIGRRVEEFDAFNDFLQSPPNGRGNH